MKHARPWPLPLLLLLAGCPRSPDPGEGGWGVPLAPDSPWPKFRRDPRQRGWTPASGPGAGEPWSFATAKGIFSTPVVGGDGTIYIGSADRSFYALHADGTERWSIPTGEIIDSSALLDDLGRVYFGSGDGILRALDAATGEPVWSFEAEPPETTGGIINWFEGNVAMGPDGTLYVPNDNFRVYAIDRETGTADWGFVLHDQTWSLPAVDPATGHLYFGNNNMLDFLGANTFAVDADGNELWSASHNGSIAASPLLTADGLLVVGGFDGYVRAYDAATGAEQWTFATRDHVYASPALLSDGTLVQPSADGTVYALDPADGALLWAFDTREPLRSSPAVDGDDRIYLGSGEGRLYVLEPDGRLAWAMELVSDGRNDLNASPALGADAVYIAGESGEVFGIPLGWCPNGGDARCIPGPGEDLFADGARLLYTTPFGAPVDEAPEAVEANATLAFSLVVREGGDTVLAHLDAGAIEVTVDPPVDVSVVVSGDRRFVTVEPLDAFVAGQEATFSLRITGDYLVDPERDGLAFSGGTPGGTYDETFTFTPAADPGLPLGVAGGEAWSLTRMAAPLPSILPSYNQIGFDSLHYLVGLLGITDGRGVAWVVGAQPADDGGVVADPATQTLFPMEVDFQDGLLTLRADQGMQLEAMGSVLGFDSFRISALLDADGAAATDPRVHVTVTCEDIAFYGPFLQALGLCNPQTDQLDVFGTALLQPHGPVVLPDLGEVQWSMTQDRITARLPDAADAAARHRFGILLLDLAGGAPAYLDYSSITSTEVDAGGLAVHLDASDADRPLDFAALLMVDAGWYDMITGEAP